MNVSQSDIADTLKSSKCVELNDQKDQVRRKDNKSLPIFTGTLRKRDAKAEEKQKVAARPNADGIYPGSLNAVEPQEEKV